GSPPWLQRRCRLLRRRQTSHRNESVPGVPSETAGDHPRSPSVLLPANRISGSYLCTVRRSLALGSGSVAISSSTRFNIFFIPFIDYVQSHSLSQVFQFNDDFPSLSMLVCIDDCFARDAIQVRCGRVIVDSK